MLTEVGDALASPRHRESFVRLVQALKSEPAVEILGPTTEWFDRGVALYADRGDKHWTLTDCISFVVMQERRLTDALTGDQHFTQAGFAALFR